jgi:hypothetical protein
MFLHFTGPLTAAQLARKQLRTPHTVARLFQNSNFCTHMFQNVPFRELAELLCFAHV